MWLSHIFLSKKALNSKADLHLKKRKNSTEPTSNDPAELEYIEKYKPVSCLL